MRFYNKTSTGDQPRVGLGILNTATPDERLDVKGGIKIDTAISQTPKAGGHIQQQRWRLPRI